MSDSYDREVVRQETTGEPVRPVTPVTTSTSRTAVYREGGSYHHRAVAIVW